MDEAAAPNSPLAIQQRIHSGRIGWAGPLLLRPAWAGLMLLVQAGLAFFFPLGMSTASRQPYASRASAMRALFCPR